MSEKNYMTIDGNEAAATIAYALSEVIAIYPITPSSPMGEHADGWSFQGRKNIWGSVPSVIEMQSEAGAAGALHGSLQGGALTTTFTASQGLLLMIPNMYKIAGELTAAVIHVAARSIAAQALSIFGDHSDVMAARGTGFGLLNSTSVQEIADMALIAHASTLKSRIPFIHFFDGFRMSHEVSKFIMPTYEEIVQMIDYEDVAKHRDRSLSPDHPVVRGTAQNPDAYFQARETVNRFYEKCPDIVQDMMDRFAGICGREYKLFQYVGDPEAERIVILMGSGCETAHETVDYLNATNDEKVGVLKVRLYRPFDMKRFVEALPPTTKAVAVLDRTKEPGSTGEPLYLDCVDAIHEGMDNGWAGFDKEPRVVGGRYGLSSKEFTPGMVKGVFDNLKNEIPRNHFTIGIYDDVTKTSLDYDPDFIIPFENRSSAQFYGLGGDGTVGANKNSIKIIGLNTDNNAQGYFVYDSKKAGAMTISHLRFGPEKIQSAYLIPNADFVACHQWSFIDRINVLEHMVEGGVFLLNTPYGPDDVWERLPRPVQEDIINKKLEFYVIDGYKVASEAGMGMRINTIMQACFFAIANVLQKDQAMDEVRKFIKKSFLTKGDDIVRKNLEAVNRSVENLHKVDVPAEVTSTKELRPPVPPDAPEFVCGVLGKMIAKKGDELPVSAFPEDGSYPTGTSQYEKRNIALEIPEWDKGSCIQCGKCSMICPHAAIRTKAYEPKYLENAPESFKHTDATDRSLKGMYYTVQVAPEDCTGCGLCVDICPGKALVKTKDEFQANLKQTLVPESTQGKLTDIDFSTVRTKGQLRKVVKNMVTDEAFENYWDGIAKAAEPTTLTRSSDKFLRQLDYAHVPVTVIEDLRLVPLEKLRIVPELKNFAQRYLKERHFEKYWRVILKCANPEPELNSLSLVRLTPELRDQERENWEFFLNIPDYERSKIDTGKVRQQQLMRPLFEFSGACAGCGETPYIKLITQLYGDRMVIANATGCSSIFGGNLPTTPYTKDARGLGPAWSNSLFEDNAEFGLGIRLAIDQQTQFAKELLRHLSTNLGDQIVREILESEQLTEAGIHEQRQRVELLKSRLAEIDAPEAPRLHNLADYLVKKSVWIVGGDGWAYDIGFGGLDHVLASGKNVNILVLDTEVYSNTGGQASKATPRSATAKFAVGGKFYAKKDLGMVGINYGNVYVASVAIGARDEQTLKAITEAEAYDGVSMIIAFSHCIEHDPNMRTALQRQQAAVESRQWLLYRYHPDRLKQGKNPLQIDTRGKSIPVMDYLEMENRFRRLQTMNPDAAYEFFNAAQEDVDSRWSFYNFLLSRKFSDEEEDEEKDQKKDKDESDNES